MRRLLGSCLARWVLAAAVAVGSVWVASAPASAQTVRPEEGQIERLYRAALGRRAEPDGFGYWVKRRLTDMTLEDVAAFFLASDEFERRFGAPDDEAFVTLVYRQVLQRDPDEEGRRYWLDRLAGDLGRRRLVLLFSESVELVARTGAAMAVLPPFQVSVRSVTASDLGSSWRPGCPVGPASLRLLELSHVDATGGAAVGRIVVHEAVATEVAATFARLYADRFPVQSLRTVDEFGGDDGASMAANNSSGFNCRLVVGGTTWSRHAHGRAIDLNPVHNPYVGGGLVLPAAGGPFVDRSAYHPLMILEGDAVVRAFDAAGWRWGGRWSSPIDHQHFERR